MSDTIMIYFLYNQDIYIITNMSEEEKAKQDVIEAVFYDDKYAYGIKINTLKYAKQINKNITIDDINTFMTKVSLETRKDIVITIHLLIIFQGMNLWWI